MTRDRELARRRVMRSVLIGHEKLEKQLQQVVKDLGLRIMSPFSRCPGCNEPHEDITKEHAWGEAPPDIFQTQERFRLCGKCNHVYWRGTHWEQMRAVLTGEDFICPSDGLRV